MPTRPAALTEEQRQLVEANLGLVGVIVSHYALPAGPHRDGEREDLFQEGVIGLMRAAAEYRRPCKIPFSSYALARIQHAVHEARRTRFTTIVPPRRARGRGPRAVPQSDAAWELVPAGGPDDDALLEDQGTRDDAGLIEDRDAPHPATGGVTGPAAGDARPLTLGELLRAKFERAVARARERSAAAEFADEDRRRLVDAVVQERLLIPDEAARTPMRQLARVTGSSYGRVAYVEEELRAAMQEELLADPEFHAISAAAWRDPLGLRRPLDEQMEVLLVTACCEEILRRCRSLAAAERQPLAALVLEAAGEGLLPLLHRRVARLTAYEREELMRSTRPAEDRHVPGRRRRRRGRKRRARMSDPM